MKAHTVWQFLKPGWGKLFVFAIFLAIMAGGMIRAWVFSNVPPKPFLYDLLQPFPIWPLWMLLLIPLALFVLLLRVIGLDIMGGPAWLFIMANLVYFYLISCLIGAGLKRASRLRRSRAGAIGAQGGPKPRPNPAATFSC